MEARTASLNRNTRETKIRLEFNLDGSGKADVATGIGFFDHMLREFARHGFFDLTLAVQGDLEVDTHHTVEDTGIVLGNAIRDALGDKIGIRRYGERILPMDESLVLCALDLSGRPYFSFGHTFPVARVGDFETEMVQEFFYAISYAAGMNLHFMILREGNSHHVIEGMFKAFGKALDEAAGADPRIAGVLSTKGSL